MCECADRLKQSDACSSQWILDNATKYCSVNICVLNPTVFWEGGLSTVELFFLSTIWFAKHFILVLVVAEVGF